MSWADQPLEYYGIAFFVTTNLYLNEHNFFPWNLNMDLNMYLKAKIISLSMMEVRDDTFFAYP